eukprot:829818-Amphidinium_carterae.1
MAGRAMMGAIAGIGVLVLSATSVCAAATVVLPHVSLDEIESSTPHAVATVYQALSELGAIVVTDVWRSEHSARTFHPHVEALRAWAACLSSGSQAHPQAVARLVAGGSIRRVSVGSSFRIHNVEQSLNVTDCELASIQHGEMHHSLKEAALALGRALDVHALEAETAVGGFTEPRSYVEEDNTDLLQLVD